MPSAALASVVPGAPQKLLNKQEAYQRYMTIFQKLNTIVTQHLQAVLARNVDRPASLSSLPRDHDFWRMINEVHETGLATEPMQAREAAHLFSQHVFKIMFKISRNYLQLEMHLRVLARLLDTFKKLKVEITSWVMFAPTDDKKFNREITVGLIQAQLLQLGEYDVHLAQMLNTRRDKATIEFAAFLVSKCILSERIVKPTSFPKTLDELTQITMTQSGKYPFVDQLIQKLSSSSHRQENQARAILARWLEYNAKFANATQDQTAAVFMPLLEQCRVLSVDQNTAAFFGCMIQICVDRSCASFREKTVHDYSCVDAFAKILMLVVKYVDKTIKVALFSRVFGTLAQLVMSSYTAVKGQGWDQRPYLRMFVSTLHQLNQPEPALEPNRFQFLEVIESVLHSLRPEKIPGFMFAWLDLISHRTFMPKLLLSPSADGKGWLMMQRLIVDLLETMRPYLEKGKLNPPIRLLYKGALRVVLVLLKDFPEFLCNFHFSFCNAIPTPCIQLRNLVLSAFPRGMSLPDPFTPNLKVDRLPEIREAPRIMSDVNVLGFREVKGLLDVALGSGPAADFFSKLQPHLLHQDRYNIPLINAIVLYVGVQAITTKRMSDHAQMQLQMLAEDLDPEGRYHLLNAIANQLRYPNNQTYYFSRILLLLFDRARKEIVQEQVTRVLLERLIVQRPHPWGLLITFIELIKNPSYSFWDHSFTRCAPEIRQLFVSVASSCMGPAGAGDAVAPVTTEPVL